jgi:uncharacterized protein
MIEAVTNGVVRGIVHRPDVETDTVVVLAHGAGSDCNSRLLIALCSAFADAGVAALRLDLPFRIAGDKVPRNQQRDRDGLRAATDLMRRRRVLVGGHSYGGRQASMLLAEDPTVAQGLLLLSYPLHPPRKPEQMRTAHFPALHSPCLFVHGTRDPFGSPEEMRHAIPTHAELMLIDKAGHELKPVIADARPVVERALQMSAI